MCEPTDEAFSRTFFAKVRAGALHVSSGSLLRMVPPVVDPPDWSWTSRMTRARYGSTRNVFHCSGEQRAPISAAGRRGSPSKVGAFTAGVAVAVRPQQRFSIRNRAIVRAFMVFFPPGPTRRRVRFVLQRRANSKLPRTYQAIGSAAACEADREHERIEARLDLVGRSRIRFGLIARLTRNCAQAPCNRATKASMWAGSVRGLKNTAFSPGSGCQAPLGL